jgi:hypothetical protein
MKNKTRAGQGFVEYVLLLMLIVAGAVLIMRILGTSVGDLYCKVAGAFNSESCTANLCEDDFTDLSGSQAVSGKWQASNGQICSPAGGGITLNSCSTSKMKASDYSVSLNDALLSKGNGYGVFFRATMTAKGLNGYIFQYDPGAKGFVMRKWVNGNEINPSIAYKSVPASYDWYSKPHTLTVKVVGDTFIGYVDGVAVLTGKDSTYKSGGSGIRTWDSTNLCVDGFAIAPIGN